MGQYNTPQMEFQFVNLRYLCCEFHVRCYCDVIFYILLLINASVQQQDASCHFVMPTFNTNKAH